MLGLLSMTSAVQIFPLLLLLASTRTLHLLLNEKNALEWRMSCCSGPLKRRHDHSMLHLLALGTTKPLTVLIFAVLASYLFFLA
jgi:hypothetical protein